MVNSLRNVGILLTVSDSATPVPRQSDVMRTALRYGIIGLGALAAFGIVVATVLAGMPGFWGALIGALLGGGFILTTALSIVATTKLPPTTTGAVLLGGWVVKMILAIAVLGVIKNMDFYSKPALGFVVIGSLLLVLGAEVYGVVRIKAPYVDDAPSSDDV